MLRVRAWVLIGTGLVKCLDQGLAECGILVDNAVDCQPAPATPAFRRQDGGAITVTTRLAMVVGTALSLMRAQCTKAVSTLQ